MMKYSFEQRKKINQYYVENGLDFDSFTNKAFKEFHVYDLDGVEGVNTYHCTPIERNVFCQIRNISVKFMPEYRIGKYYVDFCNPELNLIIEVDGKQHLKQVEYDNDRDNYLNSLGFQVVRFKGKDTFKDDDDFRDEDGKFIESMRPKYEKTSYFYFQELNKRVS